MKPNPHKGPGAIGAPPLHPMEAVNPLKPEQTLRFSRELSLTSGDAVLAMIAFSANQALASQVTVAHLVAKLAHAQSKKLAETGQAALPAGPVRDAARHRRPPARAERRQPDRTGELLGPQLRPHGVRVSGAGSPDGELASPGEPAHRVEAQADRGSRGRWRATYRLTSMCLAAFRAWARS